MKANVAEIDRNHLRPISLKRDTNPARASSASSPDLAGMRCTPKGSCITLSFSG